MSSVIIPSLSVNLQPGADAVLAAVAQGRFSSPEAYCLQLQAERLLLVSGFDELVGLWNSEDALKAAQAAFDRRS